MKRTVITVMLATAFALLAAIAISQAASTTPGRSSRVVRRTASGHERLSVFQTAKAASASPEAMLPAVTIRHLTEAGTLDSELGLEPTRATYVQFNSATHGWVVPGQSGMCLLVSKGIAILSDCGSLANVDAGSLVMVRESSSGPVIYGLVPDGASVTVANAGGSSSSVPVTSNVFMYADPAAQSVSVRAGASVTTTAVSPTD